MSPRFAGADTKFGCPVTIAPGQRRMLIASRHHSINHRRFQVAQVDEQAIQIFEEIYEACVVRIVDVQIMAKTPVDKYVRQVSKTQKTTEGKFFNKQWQNVLSANSFESLIGAISVVILFLNSFHIEIHLGLIWNEFS